MNKRKFRPLAELDVRDGDEVLESDGRKYRVIEVEPHGLALAYYLPHRAKDGVTDGRLFAVIRRSVDVGADEGSPAISAEDLEAGRVKLSPQMTPVFEKVSSGRISGDGAEPFSDPMEVGLRLAPLEFEFKAKCIDELKDALSTCINHSTWDAARAIVDRLEALK